MKIDGRNNIHYIKEKEFYYEFENLKINQICITFLFLISLHWFSFSQLTSESLTYDGENRSYLFYQPNNYDGNAQIPLVLNFHGGSGTHNEQLSLSDMRV